MDIQIKPIISEKANACSDKLNCYTFAVSPDANYCFCSPYYSPERF